MTDTVVSANGGTLSPFEQILAKLGVRPEEKKVTALLFGNTFLYGIAIGMVRVCAFTLFLEAFSSDQLALVAILLAVFGTVVTLLIERLTHRISLAGYIFILLGIIVAGLVGIRLLLSVSTNTAIIFCLPLFFEIVYMLFGLQFIALVSRLLNVRQTKRLSGLVRSGEFLAEMVGGLSIALLLNFMGVTDLLIVAAGATVLVIGLVQFIVLQFRDRLVVTTEDLSEDEQKHGRLLGMLRLPYVRLISLCYGAYIFAYFFLDVAFYDYASMQFPDQRELASFLGQFFAVVGVITLLTMVLLFAPFLKRFGILAGVIAFPIVIAIGSTAISVLELTGFDVFLIFVVMAVTNAMRFILQSAIWRPSVAILFQVLPDRQRTQGTSLIEGVIDPLSGGIAGLCLYLLSDYLGWEPEFFLLVLAVLMLAWIVMGIVIRRMYLANLVVSIQKRKLGELSLKELDNASLNIIKEGLSSSYPAEIFYCLDTLEALEHPEITELIKQVIANRNHEVRMDVLQRISRLQITPLIAQVSERIDKESDPAVRGQALKTYASLRADDTVERLTPFLDGFHRELRKGALVGLLCFDPQNEVAQDHLLRLIRADDAGERIFAAQVMGEIASGAFSGFLVELLDDTNTDVVNAAILAAGQMQDERLINILVSKMHEASSLGRASLALQAYGEAALYDLDIGFTAPNATRQVKRQIIDVVREIGGPHAIEILLRHIDIEQPELRHQVYLSLATLHYQADPDDQYVFVNKLEEEVQQITWLLAAMEDLYQQDKYHQLTAALGQELDQHRDNMLLLISFLFPSIVMLDTRANIDSKVSDLRVFALEVLDNLLTTEIKQVVLPVLDDLTVSERLAQLSVRYPQKHMPSSVRFNTLVSEHFDECHFWTKACLLKQIGEERIESHLEVVRRSLEHPEPIIRETASWALSRLNPPDLRRSLSAHADDPDPAVNEVVNALLKGLPA